MEENLLRLVLLFAGIALVAGIYLWSRFRAAGRRRSEGRETRQHPSLNGDTLHLRAQVERPAGLEQELSGLSDQIAVHRKTPPPATAPAPPAARRPDTLQHERSDAEVSNPKPDPKIVALCVKAAGNRKFRGAEIMAAVRETGLEYGDMNIFHRHASERERKNIVFSMANLVEPGSFDLGEIAGLETPGVTLFMKLPGPQDGLDMFTDMLSTGEQLASRLGGELCDQRQQTLDHEAIGQLREEIIAYRRSQQAAVSP